MLYKIAMKDIPTSYKTGARLYGTNVYFAAQKTGYGTRRLFICPTCDERRMALFRFQGELYCRSCLPFDIYHYRRNLYDEGGTALIYWNMRRLLASVGITKITYPFEYQNYLFNRPRYIRQDKYAKTIKKAQMLENMRFCALFFNKTFTAADIRAYTADSFIDRYRLQDIYGSILFASSAEIAETMARYANSP